MNYPDQVLRAMTWLSTLLVLAASLQLVASYINAGRRRRMWGHWPALAPLAAAGMGWTMDLLTIDTLLQTYMSWYLVATLACAAALGAVCSSLMTIEILPPIFDASRSLEEPWVQRAGVRRAMRVLQGVVMIVGAGVALCVAMGVGCAPGSTPWTCTAPAADGTDEPVDGQIDPHGQPLQRGGTDLPGRQPDVARDPHGTPQQEIQKRRRSPTA